MRKLALTRLCLGFGFSAVDPLGEAAGSNLMTEDDYLSLLINRLNRDIHAVGTMDPTKGRLRSKDTVGSCQTKRRPWGDKPLELYSA